MSLSVVTLSTDKDLTTTSALRAATLGATATSTEQDAHLSNLIRRSSRWAETFIRQPASVQTYRETVAGYGRRNLMLSRTPIRAVKAVYDATATSAASQVLTSEFRIEDADAGLLSRDEGFGWTTTLISRLGGLATYGGDSIPMEPTPGPGQEYKPWLIDYIAGWTYAGLTTASANWSTEAGTTDTGRTLPEDLESGVLLRAQVAYEGLDLDGLVFERLGDMQVRYETNTRSSGADPTPSNAELLLIPYRRIA